MNMCSGYHRGTAMEKPLAKLHPVEAPCARTPAPGLTERAPLISNLTYLNCARSLHT